MRKLTLSSKVLSDFISEFGVNFDYPPKNLNVFLNYRGNLLPLLEKMKGAFSKNNTVLKNCLMFYISTKVGFDGHYNPFLHALLPEVIESNQLNHLFLLINRFPELKDILIEFHQNKKSENDWEKINQIVVEDTYKDNCPYSERDLLNSIEKGNFLMINQYFLQSFGEYPIPSFYIGPNQHGFKFGSWYETHGTKQWRNHLMQNISEPRQWIYRRSGKMPEHHLWTMMLMIYFKFNSSVNK